MGLGISLICVGRLKSQWLNEGTADFAGRIEKLCSFELAEIKEPPASGKKPAEIAEKESAEIRKRFQPGAEKIYCDIAGSAISSEGLAELMDKAALDGRSKIQFFIGGAYGVSPGLLSEFDRRLSFSPMTFNHQLFRIIALEQIYRALTISRGHPYHH